MDWILLTLDFIIGLTAIIAVLVGADMNSRLGVAVILAAAIVLLIHAGRFIDDP